MIFLSIQFVVSIFFYEESKYVPSRSAPFQAAEAATVSDHKSASSEVAEMTTNGNVTEVHIDPTIKPKTYRQRMALITRSDAPIVRHIYQPVIILFTLPAVTYTALTFGCVLSCFSVIVTVQAIYLPLEPYNFGPDGVGLMQLPPFLGSILGTFVGEPISFQICDLR